MSKIIFNNYKIFCIRRNYCATSKDIKRKLSELSAMGSKGILENEKKIWARTSPADLYYVRNEHNPKIMKSSSKLQELCMTFKRVLIDRAAAARKLQVCFNFHKLSCVRKLCKSVFCQLSISHHMNHLQEKQKRVFVVISLKLVVALHPIVTILWMKMIEQWKN